MRASSDPTPLKPGNAGGGEGAAVFRQMQDVVRDLEIGVTHQLRGWRMGQFIKSRTVQADSKCQKRTSVCSCLFVDVGWIKRWPISINASFDRPFMLFCTCRNQKISGAVNGRAPVQMLIDGAWTAAGLMAERDELARMVTSISTSLSCSGTGRRAPASRRSRSGHSRRRGMLKVGRPRLGRHGRRRAPHDGSGSPKRVEFQVKRAVADLAVILVGGAKGKLLRTDDPHRRSTRDASLRTKKSSVRFCRSSRLGFRSGPRHRQRHILRPAGGHLYERKSDPHRPRAVRRRPRGRRRSVGRPAYRPAIEPRNRCDPGCRRRSSTYRKAKWAAGALTRAPGQPGVAWSKSLSENITRDYIAFAA